jgi:hypothetical protein
MIAKEGHVANVARNVGKEEEVHSKETYVKESGANY